MDNKSTITKLPHHVQQKLCQTRPPYRQGKRLTSVKVYTVNDESKHLMICGVPKLQLGEEIRKVVEPYGIIKKIHVVPDYPTEEFTEAYYVQYDRIQSARIAKRFVDGKNFYGGSLHVFYAPELETVSETKAKLLQRRRDIIKRINRNQQDAKNSETDKFIPKEQYHRRKRTPALPLTEERLTQQYPGETLSSIYDGIPQSLDPRQVSEPSLPSTSYSSQENNVSTLLQIPYHPNEAIINANETTKKSEYVGRKMKNYKGQSVDDGVKVRVVRPKLVNTSTIVKWNNSNKNVFSNPKKGQNNITIKLIPKSDEKKRIVIKDPSVSRLVQPSENLQLSIKEAKSQIRTAMQTKDKGSSVTLPLHVTGYLTNNVIGSICIKDKENIVISYVDYWGTRIDMKTVIKNVEPLAETNNFKLKQLFKYLQIISPKKKLKLYLNHGKIDDTLKFSNIVGDY